MSTHNDHNDHNDPNKSQVESSGIKARPVLLFLGILAAATAFVFVLIQGLLFAFDKLDAMNRPEPSTRVELPEGQRKLPPEPRLQGAPGMDGPTLLPLDEMKEYKQMVNEKAAGYGWVNKESGIVRIPLDRAKALDAERGLPALVQGETGEIRKAEETRKLVYAGDSNGGRMIK